MKPLDNAGFLDGSVVCSTAPQASFINRNKGVAAFQPCDACTTKNCTWFVLQANRAILVLASEETTRHAGQDGKGNFDFQTPDTALSDFGPTPPYLGSLRSHAYYGQTITFQRLVGLLFACPVTVAP